MEYQLCITVGGKLPRTNIDCFCEALEELMFDMDDGYKEDLENMTSPSGTFIEGNIESNEDYSGSDQTIAGIIKIHELPFHISVDNSGDHVGDWFWIPGMENVVFQPREVTVTVESLSALINLLLDVAQNGTDNIPLYLHKEGFEEIAKKCSEQPDKTVEIIREYINRLFPMNVLPIPEIPKLEIV